MDEDKDGIGAKLSIHTENTGTMHPKTLLDEMLNEPRSYTRQSKPAIPPNLVLEAGSSSGEGPE